jgi:hypothetical protein
MCVDCGKQLCCKADPRSANRRRENQIIIEKLRGKNLEPYERGFCDAVQHNRLGPIHQGILNSLAQKYLKGDHENTQGKNSAPEER